MDPAASAGDYLEKHHIYGLFENLMQQLIIHKPTDPIDFLIHHLQNPSPLKIIILGAPASGKGTQCEYIVENYGVVHISTGDILREEVKKQTDIGAEVKAFIENGLLVPDKLIIDVVLKKLTSHECQTKGWLLDGFPRTRAQALALQTAGVFPDKVVLLDIPDSVLVERVEGRRTDPVTGVIYHLKFNPPPSEIAPRLEQRADDTAEKIKARLAAYHNNLRGIKDCYASIIGTIDANKSKDKVWADVMEYLEKVPAKGPRKPLRICIVGPPASGKRTQAELLSQKHGFVHISVKKLIRDSGNAALGEMVRSRMALFEDKDKVIVPLLKSRINMIDCLTNGWVIDGFPTNILQAREFEKAGIIPNKVIFLDNISDSELTQRVENRRVDPHTGIFYELGKVDNVSEDIVKRLQRHKDDEKETFEKVFLREYKENADELKKFYQQHKKINAAQPVQTVHELVEDFIRS